MFEFLRTFVGFVVPAALGLTWVFGALAGMVYWAWRYDYDAVVWSVVIPFYGAMSVANQFLP